MGDKQAKSPRIGKLLGGFEEPQDSQQAGTERVVGHSF
jgi:hypothetical protein